MPTFCHPLKFYYATVIFWILECSPASCCFFHYVALNQVFSPHCGQLQLRHCELAYKASRPSWGGRLGWTCAASQGKEICNSQICPLRTVTAVMNVMNEFPFLLHNFRTYSPSILSSWCVCCLCVFAYAYRIKTNQMPLNGLLHL